MKPRNRGESSRVTTVCIDSWENGVPTGRFYNPCLPTGQQFGSLMQFLQAMEQALDEVDFPRSFSAMRSFLPPTEGAPDPAVTMEYTGRLATLQLRILFRQNVSWQGSVTWLEGGQEQSFRSALELILLMDNALRYSVAAS